MNKIILLVLIIGSFLFSCSSDEPDLDEEIIGGWQLERIRVEGADCKAIFGDNVPEVYLADEVGCASPDEILGNASRCINFDLVGNGEGKFLWSVITGQEDASITYTITNDEIEYCFVGSLCSGSYELVNGKLESVVELRLDQECNAVFVLRRK